MAKWWDDRATLVRKQKNGEVPPPPVTVVAPRRSSIYETDWGQWLRTTHTSTFYSLIIGLLEYRTVNILTEVSSIYSLVISIWILSIGSSFLILSRPSVLLLILAMSLPSAPQARPLYARSTLYI